MTTEPNNPNNPQIPVTPKFSPFPYRSEELIAVYTAVSILFRIRKELGLEAMLEYMEHYLMTIEKHNSRLKIAVTLALSFTNTEKMYNDVVRPEEKN